MEAIEMVVKKIWKRQRLIESFLPLAMATALKLNLTVTYQESNYTKKQVKSMEE